MRGVALCTEDSFPVDIPEAPATMCRVTLPSARCPASLATAEPARPRPPCLVTISTFPVCLCPVPTEGGAARERRSACNTSHRHEP
jgi:hypothetical protein